MQSRDAIRRPARLLLGLACTLAVSTARGDEASGRVSGQVEGRTSTFRERNTEVLAPSLAVRLDLPNGMTTRGYYLADVITSASVAIDVVSSASVGVDPLARSSFSEVRHEAGATVQGPIRVGPNELVLGADLRYSHEPDYQSYTATVRGTHSFDERASAIGVALTYAHDEVWQRVRMADPSTGEPVSQIIRPFPSSDFDGLVVAAFLERVLARRVQLNASYELGWLSGYLGSPYRRLRVDGIVQREHVPETRLRHTLSARLRVAFPETRSALHLLLRGYTDDWSVHALTTDVRWYQELGRYLLLRLRHRYYVQTAAFFDSGQGVVAPSYYAGTEFTTSNPRYEAMRSHEIGGAFVTHLGFLSRSRSELLAATELELSFDYRFATNRYGDAVLGAFSVRVPFR